MIQSLRLRSGRLMIAIVAASVTAAFAAGSAFANSGTGSQNPELTVYVSLTPDCMTPGGSQTRFFSVTNNTHQAERVTLGWVLTHDGVVYYTAPPRTFSIRPNQTWVGESETVTAYPSQGLGTYTETRSATDIEGTSSATATYAFASSCP